MGVIGSALDQCESEELRGDDERTEGGFVNWHVCRYQHWYKGVAFNESTQVMSLGGELILAHSSSFVVGIEGRSNVHPSPFREKRGLKVLRPTLEELPICKEIDP